MFTELATMLTDYALGALCAVLSWLLWMRGQAKMRMSVRYWAAGIGSLALASIAGGTVHGWRLILTEPVVSALWKAAIFSVGLASFCFLAGTLTASFAPAVRRLLMVIPVVQLVSYMIWMTRHNEFRYVIYNYGGTFVLILLSQIYELFNRKPRSAAWIIAGVSVSFLAALVQRTGIALHATFNHNDLYHVVQMAGVALLYRGAALLHDRR
jgi:hypothetical protein